MVLGVFPCSLPARIRVNSQNSPESVLLLLFPNKPTANRYRVNFFCPSRRAAVFSPARPITFFDASPSRIHFFRPHARRRRRRGESALRRASRCDRTDAILASRPSLLRRDPDAYGVDACSRDAQGTRVKSSTWEISARSRPPSASRSRYIQLPVADD